MKAENELTVQSAGAEDRGPDVPLRGAGRPARGARLCEGSAGVSAAGEGDGHGEDRGAHHTQRPPGAGVQALVSSVLCCI